MKNVIPVWKPPEISSTDLRYVLCHDLGKARTILHPHVFDYIQNNKVY